jgi:hypothetical protein
MSKSPFVQYHRLTCSECGHVPAAKERPTALKVLANCRNPQCRSFGITWELTMVQIEGTPVSRDFAADFIRA